MQQALVTDHRRLLCFRGFTSPLVAAAGAAKTDSHNAVYAVSAGLEPYPTGIWTPESLKCDFLPQ